MRSRPDQKREKAGVRNARTNPVPRLSAAHEQTTALQLQRALANPQAMTADQIIQMQQMLGNRAVEQLLSSHAQSVQPVAAQPMISQPLEQSGAVGRDTQAAAEPVVQTKANRTGMPDQLKEGLESLSGMDLSDVRVHYNSDKPAQVQALAYAQGSEIHLAPGQERHLPHEGWHVVQQRQGRVRPTMQLGGVSINDDRSLEGEADRMGSKAASLQRTASPTADSTAQRKEVPESGKSAAVRQHAVETTGSVVQRKAKVIVDEGGLKVERDGDYKYVEKDNYGLKKGNVYRHMSPKDVRLSVPRRFYQKNYAERPVFKKAQEEIVTLQNQLSGWEYYTEHLGAQFMGSAEGNKKLTRGEYDSIMLAAEQQGSKITKQMIAEEMQALSELYMYKYLSKRPLDNPEFIEALQSKSQLTLDAFSIGPFMQEEIMQTAGKLGMDPNVVLRMLMDYLDPNKVQEAMARIAIGAKKAFVDGEWIGPTTKTGEPNRTYYTPEQPRPYDPESPAYDPGSSRTTTSRQTSLMDYMQ
ncbi:DUF4157 domain-containing protein [Brevibacillus humidisoli]|uniref:eCIS core domain-containing protein n=1 Tax=Brevibacillus humidisoli TaxID=2895522 RepID=UPI001E5478B0|nr:DUF4157 domain-containing protein [Brevibacillus humidisoli]UFJ40745.1 DUF4157 domain-containing protein [Brevibacillus humidisoli]